MSQLVPFVLQVDSASVCVGASTITLKLSHSQLYSLLQDVATKEIAIAVIVIVRIRFIKLDLLYKDIKTCSQS